jgi:hypothetical protein
VEVFPSTGRNVSSSSFPSSVLFSSSSSKGRYTPLGEELNMREADKCFNLRSIQVRVCWNFCVITRPFVIVCFAQMRFFLNFVFRGVEKSAV